MIYNASGVTCQLGIFVLNAYTFSAFNYSKYSYCCQWKIGNSSGTE